MRKVKALLIGLTGGIATGKTAVALQFAGLGARVISADAVSRKIMRQGKPCWKRTVALFGRGITYKSGAINRKKLASIIFSDKQKRKALDKITHPAIIKEIRSISAGLLRRGKKPVIVEAPLLFEAGLKNEFDRVIVVWAPEKKQIERLRKHKKLGKMEIMARIASQIPMSRKLKMGDYRIDNSGNLAKTGKSVKNIWNLLTSAR